MTLMTMSFVFTLPAHGMLVYSVSYFKERFLIEGSGLFAPEQMNLWYRFFWGGWGGGVSQIEPHFGYRGAFCFQLGCGFGLL